MCHLVLVSLSFGLSSSLLLLLSLLLLSLLWLDVLVSAGGVVPALFSSWLWFLLVFTVVVLAIDGAGVVVVLVVFVVKWLLLWCANCDLCKNQRSD